MKDSGGWLGRLLAMPIAAFGYAIGKWKAMSDSERMLESAEPLGLPQASVMKLAHAWSKLGAEAGAAGSWDKPELKPDESMLIERIRLETAEHNRNNVTRTEAYRTLYFQYPELHWALLAHMVSRNGGWNMTDLRGEWLPRLLTEKQRKDVFLLLERSNALIFQDAYPQLLLYHWSRRLDRNLFHLLPSFGVSVFMGPVWRMFWHERNSPLLTVALIVNEQHYIERRVVRNDYFKERVLKTLFFGLQSLMQLNGVIFPYGSGKTEEERELRLSGLILESFENLSERIAFGKSLYAMLFGIPRILEGVRSFAAAVKHTGSRSDYAPLLFQAIRHEPPRRVYKEKLLGGHLKKGAAPIYSPRLPDAWKDHPVDPPEQGDWFTGSAEALSHFRELPLPSIFEITNEYGLMLNKLELAVLAAQRQGKRGR
ncbi:DUF2515 domain-containing protein [Paenibacillus sp. HB172176]|uniref:DUF2515 domain-containing protein n=1 Tax=Paenibacillus sp. HB172176 TaxID=2493690 RepID=UPI001F10D428|nr:DUF2515 domain-containing protein [Paenibacillus sp. HB172176]